MKHAFVALAGLALLAGANTARAADPLDERLDQAWADLNSKWLQGQIDDARFQEVTELLIKITENAKSYYAEAPTIRYRLQGALEDLRARSALALKQAQYVDSIWEQIIDFRLNRALAIIKARANAGPTQDADWQELMDLLNKRAQAAKDDAATTPIVLAALQAQANELKARAVKGALNPTDFKPLELNLAENRLYRTSRWLLSRTNDLSRKTATHYDYVRVRDTVSDRNSSSGIAADVTTAYLAAIDTLEAAYGNDRITKDMFDKLMEQLKVRYLAATGR